MICDIEIKTTSEELCTLDGLLQNFEGLKLVVEKLCCIETGENFSTLIPQSVCRGEDVTLRVIGGTSWAWTGPNSFVSTDQEPVINNIQDNGAGLYTVIITDAASECTYTKYIYLQVNECCPVNIPGVGTTEAALGDTASFFLILPDGYTLDTVSWEGPSGYTSAVQNPTIVINNFNQQGIYTATITLNECTGEFKTYLYLEVNPVYFPTINPVPAPPPNTEDCDNGDYLNQFIIDTNGSTWFIDYNGCAILLREECGNESVYVAGSPVTCLDDTILLFASGGASYAWSGPNGFNSALQNPTVLADNINKAGLYTCVITLANGCTSTKAVYVSVINCPPPVAGIDLNCESEIASS